MESAIAVSSSAVQPLPKTRTPRPKHRPTILIAEDAADTRLILTRTIEFENYNFVTAVDGEEALEKAVRFRPHLILLDLMLPKLNGFQILMQLKHLGCKSKVCMISSVDNDDFIRCALDFGAQDYIVKPIVPDFLAHKVRRLLEIQEDSNYFQLPCSLATKVVEETRKLKCEVRHVSEVGLVLRTPIAFEKGCVLSLNSPSLARIMQRDPPLLVTVANVSKNRRHHERFDVEADFVGLSEMQRQRLRAAVIRGKFLADSTPIP